MPCSGHVKRKRTLSERAGPQFPVARVQRYLRSGYFAPRVSATASVFMSAILEYLCAKVLEMAGKETMKHKSPRHLFLSVQKDQDLSELFESVTISRGGYGQYLRFPRPLSHRREGHSNITGPATGDSGTGQDRVGASLVVCDSAFTGL
ncbi:histone H2A-beta, sperm-like [Portunus trituberculatus]|uniref:histone H2A-beta, sperm-like n=1 Tax=Portunus trituberculatus TaxID=210409 RepID=UPI001E1CF595|nr:histone H2A-beta, sperm-like [Portunus trituberculatus]